MDRRRFLQNLAATAAAAKAACALDPLAAAAAPIEPLTTAAAPIEQARAASAPRAPAASRRAVRAANSVNVDGHTLLCEFTEHGPARADRTTPSRDSGGAAGAAHADGAVRGSTRDAGRGGVRWKVYEDLRVRDGVITFVGSQGEARVLPKSAEAAFADEGAPFLGLSIDEIGLAGRDLLAEKLLAGGDDPDPAQVRSAAPPQGSAPQQGQGRGRWVTFVGTKEAYDVTPVYPSGSTRTWLPSQFFPELRELRPPAPGEQAASPPTEKRYHGLVGGWMPAVRTIIELSPSAYIEHVVFGDVHAKDTFIIQTWHRSAKVEAGTVTKVVFGYTYPPYPPARQPPPAESFYRALLAFASYWDGQLDQCVHASLPDESWVDMAKHGFAKELMIRPGGISPKYGGVDRDYFGAEYDGFQDIFTSALYTNLEWGRFDTARVFLDDYFTKYVEPTGMINMRGPETAQFGLTLSLLARYARYTHDAALLLKHRGKIEATAKVLTDLHDISLALPPDDATHGLIRGWSESDACLHPDPSVWWQPYYANSAFAARGLKDLAGTWQTLAPPRTGANGAGMRALARAWMARSAQLEQAVVASMQRQYRRDLNPPYMPPMPGVTLPFREAMEKERPSPQQWPHRLYAELLQADVLPADLAHQTIDTLRQYGGTTLGVVANIGIARPGARSILGFISYGYAQMLLRLDRIEEYLLFLYAHRYHDHTRGSWTAGEVSGIRGGTALFCIPAQQTIPLLVRWMLVLEDSDAERLYFGKAIPRTWTASGRPVTIEQAPTRWGRVTFTLSMPAGAETAAAIGANAAAAAGKQVVAKVELARPGTPPEIHVALRTPKGATIQRVTVNGRPATLGGRHGDTVIIQTGGEQRFEVVGQLA
jgi:hypothetical protein